ncbi:hypothetical protein NHF46_03155 [Arthrobacter alpinus]|nr:hypothetical protein [Arthrobacter alpinus]
MILGLFVWFFLLSQVYLISAAIAAVLAADLRPAGNGARPLLTGRAASAAFAETDGAPSSQTLRNV